MSKVPRIVVAHLAHRRSCVPHAGEHGVYDIAEAVGGHNDFLVRAGGTVMNALAGNYALRAIDGVAKFKLIQHLPRDLGRSDAATVADAIATSGGRRIAQLVASAHPVHRTWTE